MATWELWVSVACIVFGLLLILLEVVNPGFFIAVPGTVLAGFGFVSLFLPGFFFGNGAAIAIPVFGIPATLLTLWAYKRVAPADQPPTTLSEDNLPGRTGTVDKAIPADGSGRVIVAGQSFRAVAAAPVSEGTKIKVLSVDGLTITVKEI